MCKPVGKLEKSNIRVTDESHFVNERIFKLFFDKWRIFCALKGLQVVEESISSFTQYLIYWDKKVSHEAEYGWRDIKNLMEKWGQEKLEWVF